MFANIVACIIGLRASASAPVHLINDAWRIPDDRIRYAKHICICHILNADIGMPHLIEGIVTTLNADSSINIAPMGPIVINAQSLLFRPFHSSQTYSNLKVNRRGLFHLIDDVLLLACAALDVQTQRLQTVAVPGTELFRLKDCCQWSEFEVLTVVEAEQRSDMLCRLLRTEVIRPFRGWNRATHAMIELIIMATRLHLLSAESVDQERERTSVLIEKTGAENERAAFELVCQHIEDYRRTHC